MTRRQRIVSLLDIRFEASAETAFKHDMDKKLATAVLYIFPLALVVTALRLFSVYHREVNRPNHTFAWDTRDPRTGFMVLWLTLHISALCLLGGCLLQQKYMFPRRFTFELFVVLHLCLEIGISTFANRRNVALLLGQQATEVWGDAAADSEKLSILFADGMVTVCALLLPIRTCFFWMIPTTSFAVFAGGIGALGSPDPLSVHITLSALAALFFMATVGEWKVEKYVRSEWLAVAALSQTRKKLREATNFAQLQAASLDDQELQLDRTRAAIYRQTRDLTRRDAQLAVLETKWAEKELLLLETECRLDTLRHHATQKEREAKERQARIEEISYMIRVKTETLNVQEVRIQQLLTQLHDLEGEAQDALGPLPGRFDVQPQEPLGFDGHWALSSGHAETAMWLHVLVIKGDHVQCGDGSHASLNRTGDGRTFLEGGVLSLKGHRLQRIGKTMREMIFHRLQGTGEQDRKERASREAPLSP